MAGIEAFRDQLDAAPSVNPRRTVAARFLRSPAGSTACVLLLACLGVVLILQGWKSRIPRFDMVLSIEATQDLIDRGAFPDKGILTSFGSYTPPGVTWLLLPGVVVFEDHRLFEYVGSVGLFVGTLFGIFFPWHAGISVSYPRYWPSFSTAGQSSVSWQEVRLFPTHTTRCFYVWMIYCVGRWVDEDNPHFLAGAILVWAVGIVCVHGNGAGHPGRSRRLAVEPTFGSTCAAGDCCCSRGRPLVSVPTVRSRPGFRRPSVSGLTRIDSADRFQQALVRPGSRSGDVAAGRQPRPNFAGSQSRSTSGARTTVGAERIGVVMKTRRPGSGVQLFLEPASRFSLLLMGWRHRCWPARRVSAGHEKAVWRRRTTSLAGFAAVLGIALDEIVLTRFVAAEGA